MLKQNLKKNDLYHRQQGAHNNNNKKEKLSLIKMS